MVPLGFSLEAFACAFLCAAGRWGGWCLLGETSASGRPRSVLLGKGGEKMVSLMRMSELFDID